MVNSTTVYSLVFLFFFMLIASCFLIVLFTTFRLTSPLTFTGDSVFTELSEPSLISSVFQLALPRDRRHLPGLGAMASLC